MPAADNEAEEIFQFLPLRQGELQLDGLGLPVHAILGGDTAGLVLVGLATGLLGRLRLGLGRGGRRRGRGRGGRRRRCRRGGGRRCGRGRSSLGNRSCGRRRGSDRDRGSVAGGSRRLSQAGGNLRDRLGRFEANTGAGGGSRGVHGRKAGQAQAAGFAGLGGGGSQQQGGNDDELTHWKSPLFDGRETRAAAQCVM